MTPNPNPSPELREAAEALLLAMTTRALRGRDHVPSMRDEQTAASALRAALSQRLPAPGEVEHGTGWVAWNPDSGEEYTPNHPVESGECVEAERIRHSTPQEDTLWTAFQEQFMRAEALATIAAANDEGVALQAAEALLPYTSHAIGCAIYQQTWANGAPKCNCGIDEARAAIRLLSQGGGKA